MATPPKGFEQHANAMHGTGFYVWGSRDSSPIPSSFMPSAKENIAHVFISAAASKAPTEWGVAVSVGERAPNDVPCIMFTPGEALALASMLVEAAGDAAANAAANAAIDARRERKE